jgi:hypothetical protein
MFSLQQNLGERKMVEQVLPRRVGREGGEARWPNNVYTCK